MQGKAQTVGNGFRTIAINIANMAEKTDTWTAANGKVNVALKDSEGNIRSTYEIMKDLYEGVEGTSTAWDKLSEAEQNEIAVAAAGKTRYDVFTSSMGNFQSAIFATETALNSSGSAMKENEAALDSIQGHLARLKSSFEAFAHKTLSSDFVKGIIDAGTAVLDFFGSDLGQGALQFGAIAAGIGVITKAVGKLKSVVSGMSVAQGLKTLIFGVAQAATEDAAAMAADTAATEANTRAKVKNAAANRSQSAAMGKNFKGANARAKAGKGLDIADDTMDTVSALTNVDKSAGKAQGSVSKLTTVFGKLKGVMVAHPLLTLVGAFSAFVGIAAALNPNLETTTRNMQKAKEQAAGLEDEISKLSNSQSGLSESDQARLESLKQELEYLNQIVAKEKERSVKNINSGQTLGNKGGGKDGINTELDKQLEKRQDALAEVTFRQRRYNELVAEGASEEKKAAALQNLASATNSAEKANQSLYDSFKEIDNAIRDEDGNVDQEMFKELDPAVQKSYKKVANQLKDIEEGTEGVITGSEKYNATLQELKDNQEAYGDVPITKQTAKDLESLVPNASELAKSEEGMATLTKRVRDYESVMSGTKASGAIWEGMLQNVNDLSEAQIKVNKEGKAVLNPADIQEYAKAAGYTADEFTNMALAQEKAGTVEWKLPKKDLKEIQQSVADTGQAMVDADGTVTMTMANFRQLGETMNWTEAQTSMYASALNTAGSAIVDASADANTLTSQLVKCGDEFGVIKNKAGKVSEIDLGKFTKGFEKTGATTHDIQQMIDTLEEAGNIKFSGKKDLFDKWGVSAKKATKETKKLHKQAEETADETYQMELETNTKDADKNIKKTKQAAEELDKTKADAQVGVEGAEEATKQTKKAKDEVESMNGTKGTGKVDAKDEASGKARTAKQQVTSFNGLMAWALLQALNGVSPGIGSATSMLAAFAAMPFAATLTAKDDASAPTEGATSKVQAFANTPGTVTLGANDNASSTIGYVQGLLASLPSSKTINIHTSYTSSGTPPKNNATGKKKGEKGGLSWVGDEGSKLNPKPELVQTKDGAYLAGTKGWELVHLDDDDIVYTAAQTKQLLSGRFKDFADSYFPRFAKGKKKSNKQKEKEKKKREKQKKKVDRLKDQFETQLSRLEDKRDMYNWSDAYFQKQYDKLYKKYNKKVKKANKKLGKKSGLGSQAKWEKKVSKREIQNEQAETQIDTALEGFEDDIATWTASQNDSDRTTALNAISAAEKQIKAARKAKKISAEEEKEYLKQIQEARMEVWRVDAEKAVEAHKQEKKTYKDSVKAVTDMWKAKKISAEDYYEFLDQLSEQQYEQEIARMEKEQEKRENQLELADLYLEKEANAIQKQIDELEETIDEQDDLNELLEAQKELMEAEAELAQAKSQRVKIYREGEGFVYEQEAEAVREAQEAIKDAQEEIEDIETQKKIEELEKQLEKIEEIQEMMSEVETDAEIKDLENKLGTTVEALFGSLGWDVDNWEPVIKQLQQEKLGYEDILEWLEENSDKEINIGTLLGETGTVSNSTINSYIGKNKFASGTLSASGGLSLVGEHGAELRVLNRGDGILPNDITSNLMAWGRISPTDYSQSAKNNKNEVQEFSYNFSKLVLPNVTDANSFVKELQRLPNQAVQKANRRV